MIANAIVLATKYGKIMSANPQTSGTPAFCFLPYMKYANPKAPNNKPQRSHHSFNLTSRFRDGESLAVSEGRMAPVRTAPSQVENG